MSTEPGRTLGERVAELRTRLGLSQKELAAEVGRSESWVSQVERDQLKVERVPVLRALADALQVSIPDLRPEATAPAPAGPASRESGLEALRLVLTGHPSPAELLAPRTPAPVDLARLGEQVDHAWGLTHACSTGEAAAALAELIPHLERARRTAPAEHGLPLATLLSSVYQAAAAACAQVDEADAAWVAADRSITVADSAGDALGAIAGHFRLAHAFITLRRLDQAEHVAVSGIQALEPLIHADSPAPEQLSVYGALTLTLGVVHAMAGRRAPARDALASAREVARRLGADRDDHGTEFGPTNVELHAVAVAVELGDAGEALEIAETVQATDLSPERRARLTIDIARAHTQRRHIGEAVDALLEAERLTPDGTLRDSLSRNLIRDLLALTGRRPPEGLQQLARRAGAAP